MISLTIIMIFIIFMCIFAQLDKMNVPIKVNFILSGIITCVIGLIINAIL